MDGRGHGAEGRGVWRGPSAAPGPARGNSAMATHAMAPIDAAWYHMDGPVNFALVTGDPADPEAARLREGERRLPAAPRPLRPLSPARRREGISRREAAMGGHAWLRHRPAAPSHRPARAARPRRARGADQRPRQHAARSRAPAVAGPRRRRRRRRQRADHAHPSLHRRRHRGDGDLRRAVRHDARRARRRGGGSRRQRGARRGWSAACSPRPWRRSEGRLDG